MQSAPIKVCCSGGGIFFFWQLGALRWLQRAGCLDDTAQFLGYSAGALSATLAACDVPMHRAVDAAYALTLKHNIWQRPLGLLGVWGGYVV